MRRAGVAIVALLGLGLPGAAPLRAQPWELPGVDAGWLACTAPPGSGAMRELACVHTLPDRSTGHYRGEVTFPDAAVAFGRSRRLDWMVRTATAGSAAPGGLAGAYAATSPAARGTERNMLARPGDPAIILVPTTLEGQRPPFPVYHAAALRLVGAP